MRELLGPEWFTRGLRKPADLRHKETIMFQTEFEFTLPMATLTPKAICIATE